MSPDKSHDSGWPAVLLVAITYVYFLIFAQFAFLHRLAALSIARDNLNAVMTAMAFGGILFSLSTPRIKFLLSSRMRLRVGFGTCGTAAFLAICPLTVVLAIFVALLIGAGLGLLTVTLATHLGEWCGNRNQLLKIGFGTGIGYLLCNVPPFFAASPQTQAIVASILCFAGIFIAPSKSTQQPPAKSSTLPFAFIVACFAALVWLDSAAFFIIQSTSALKAGTWQGTAHLWTNGSLHLVAAVASAWLLSRRSALFVLSVAFLFLAFACLFLLAPPPALPASAFYPIGVSLYSVALVAYPSLLAPAQSLAGRGRQAGWIYAIAGWVGSALGIGMGQNLGHVPPLFVAAAGVIVLFPALVSLMQNRPRELAVVALVLLVAFIVDSAMPSPHPSASLSAVERGRQVYIAEGCISCHSQYVRPNSRDVQMWGPVESLTEIRSQRPPLIGNRRQGPDLAEIGARRSPLWLKMHFFNPAEVSGASIMPSFAFLFRNGRGDDLIAYLSALRGPGATEHIAEESCWHLPAAALAQANASNGRRLFQRNCATCHTSTGATRIAWQASFRKLPPELARGPISPLAFTAPALARIHRIAQVAKFGIPGTDMAGHEYLNDNDLASISLWLAETTPNRP